MQSRPSPAPRSEAPAAAAVGRARGLARGEQREPVAGTRTRARFTARLMEHIGTRSASGRGRWRRGVRAAVALSLTAAAVLAVVALAASGGADPRPTSSPSPAPAPSPEATPAQGAVQASVSVDTRRRGPAVPPAYLGLSFEATDLRQLASYGERGNLATLLRSLGPGLLRFGGISADTRIAWSDVATPRPAWTSRLLEARDLRALRSLAERSGWRVLLTVGLVHFDPQAAAREVAAAKRLLGPWLAAVEVGNEPDAYAKHHQRSRAWSDATYGAQVRSYRSAIARLVPDVALAGPGVSGSQAFVAWGPREAHAQQPALLTGHHYPLGCHQQPPPSIARLLSVQTRRLEASSLRRYMKVSRESGIPFRMDEANSVSCGGRPGISNTFASALWATSYIARSMAAGTAGINFQGNPANCLGYAPVCAPTRQRLAAGALGAQPLWYALLLTRGLVGDRPVHTAVSAPASTNVSVTALLAGDGGLRFVIVEADPRSAPAVSVSLRVGARFGAASILRLSAPALDATSGVTLGGSTVAGDGSWRPPGSLPRAALNDGVITVTIPAGSAALVTVPPSMGAAAG
jgi:hypothetical protein